jgi:hypothetical protein
MVASSTAGITTDEELEQMKQDLLKASKNDQDLHQQQLDDEDQKLANEIKLTVEDINFIISTIRKEAEHDEISIKQLFYGMASASTKVPIPHIVYSKDPGAGKSYLLELVSSYFPTKYVIVLSGMSNKALLHREGVLVSKNKDSEKLEPITPIIEALESEAEELDGQIRAEQLKQQTPPSSFKDKDLIRQNKQRLNEINIEIKDIKSNASKLIDLSNQIILCLDTPQDSVYDALMSLISQDTSRDQQYSFVEKSDSGKIGTKNNIIRGMPVLFSTQVIDDSRSERFAEKNRRFVNVTPDTSTRKIGTAKGIIGLRYGSLPEEYDESVVSRDDRDRVKHLVNVLLAKLRQHSKDLQSKDSGVKIPFVKAVSDSIPNTKVWNMTIVERMMKYITIIAKVNMDFRPKLVNEQTGQIYPIATFEDLKGALKLMERGANSVRPYIANWFNDVFIPAFKALDGKPNEDTIEQDGSIIIKERHVGLTTEQLADKTKEVYGGSKPSSKELLEKYLYPLLNQGIVNYTASLINRKFNIFFPVEEVNITSIFKDPDNPKLNVSSPDIFPSKNVLKEEFRILSKRYSNEGVNFNKIFSGYYKLLDADGKTEITLDDMIDRYFGSPEEVFTKAYRGRETALSNILYQQQVIFNHNYNQIQKNYFISHPAWNNVLTEFPNNTIEHNTTVESKSNEPEPEPEPKSKVEGSFKCFYCEERFSSNDKRREHRQEYHSDKKLDCPTPEDFEKRLER